jgi:hypothetical protein
VQVMAHQREAYLGNSHIFTHPEACCESAQWQ